jgi:hypothetical protein
MNTLVGYISLIFLSALSPFAFAQADQGDEIIITAYKVPLSFGQWAFENHFDSGGLGAAAAGSQYSIYMTQIAKANACIDKKNKLTAAAAKRLACIKQAPLDTATANIQCTQITELSVDITLGVDLRTIFAFNINGTAKWNPNAACRQKNADLEVLAIGKCESDLTDTTNRLNFQYRDLNCK